MLKGGWGGATTRVLIPALLPLFHKGCTCYKEPIFSTLALYLLI